MFEDQVKRQDVSDTGKENHSGWSLYRGRWIGINSAMMRTPEKGKKMDYKKELQEIIGQVESAKNRLAEVTEAMDFDDKGNADLFSYIFLGLSSNEFLNWLYQFGAQDGLKGYWLSVIYYRFAVNS